MNTTSTNQYFSYDHKKLIPKSTFYASTKKDPSNYRRQLLIQQKNKDLHHLTINKAKLAERYEHPSREKLGSEEVITIQDEKDPSPVLVVTGEDAPV